MAYRRLVAIVGVIALFISIPAPSANADTASSTERAARAVYERVGNSPVALKALTQEERRLFDLYTQPSGVTYSVSTGPDRSARAGGCLTLNPTWTHRNAFGVTLYRFGYTTSACGDGSSILVINLPSYRWETISMYGWQWVPSGRTAWSQNLSWEVRIVGQERFQYVLTGQLIQDRWECGQTRINANAVNYRLMGSCDVWAA